jgi:SAM-dependent methyltransferase
MPRHAADRGIQDFDESYLGTPPWDIGRPQPMFSALMEDGEIRGRVLDAGCGTGEHTLMVAAHGLDATGIDASPRAIGIAKHKATDRDVGARFLVWDALALADLNERFDTVLDSGLFHVFDDERRAQYVTSLTTVVRPEDVCCSLALAIASLATGDPAASDRPNCEMLSRMAGSSNRSNQCSSRSTSSHAQLRPGWRASVTVPIESRHGGILSSAPRRRISGTDRLIGEAWASVAGHGPALAVTGLRPLRDAVRSAT